MQIVFKQETFTCTCQNGTPAVMPACTSNGEHCSRCDLGYAIFPGARVCAVQRNDNVFFHNFPLSVVA